MRSFPPNLGLGRKGVSPSVDWSLIVLAPNSDIFVVRGIAHAPSGAVPQRVKTIAKIIDAPFYSMDVIENSAGEL